MKKIKLLLVLAMVFGALLFNSEIKAQTTVPVLLSSTSNRISGWTGSTTWYLTLHNNTTNEDYYLQTHWYDLHDDGMFHLGNITPGTYTVTLSYYNYVWDEYFDWNINDQSGYNFHMYSGTDYTYTDNVVVSDDTFYTANYGLTLYMFAN